MKTNEELTEQLTAPLPKEAIKPHPTKTYLSAIKAIYVTERLSQVFGIGGWRLKTELIKEGEKGMIVVKVTLEVPDYDIYYESFGGNDNGGENSKNFDLGDAYKGATTDAITKIGSYLGIGIDVFKGKVPAGPQQPTPVREPSVDDKVASMQGRLNPDLPDGLAQSILNAQTQSDLRTIWESNTDLHKVKKFTDAVTQRKSDLLKQGDK
jgi:hypothetical protein